MNLRSKLILVLIFSFSIFSQAQIPNFDWVRNYSGYSSSSDFAHISCATTDGSGNIYSGGFFIGTIDFDPGPGISILTATSSLEGFVTKTSPTGNLIWVKHFVSDNEAIIHSIVADSSDGIFLCGAFQGKLDCNPGPGSFPLNSLSLNSFIIKLDTLGDFYWAKSINNTGGDVILNASLIDHSQNLLFTGSYSGGTPDMNPGLPVYTLGSSCSGTESFTLKLDHDGNFIWAKSAGQLCSNIVILDLATDSKSNVYLSGAYFGSKDFDPGIAVYSLPSGGSYDLFVSKLDSNGNFIQAIGLGSTRTEEAKGISIDKADNIYITGLFTDKTDFDPSLDTLFLSPTGFSSNNIFVAKYNSSLSLKWAKSFSNPPTSGSGYGYGFKLACDNDCHVNTMGLFNGNLDFNPGVDTAILRTKVESIFISRLDSSGKFIWAGQLNGTSNFLSGGILSDDDNNVYTFGGFSGRTDFNPSVDSVNIIPVGDDGFLHKLSICKPFDTTDIIACRVFSLDGKSYTSSGTYTQYLKTKPDCFVSLTFNLKIEDVNDTISKSGNTLSAKGMGTSYQWVNCPFYTPVIGANSPTFTPVIDGDYALIIKNGSCTDTSKCHSVIGTEIKESKDDELGLLLMPNPANNQTVLSFKKPVKQVDIELLALTGAILWSSKNINGQDVNINLQNLNSGIYLIKIKQQDKGIVIKKLIKF